MKEEVRIASDQSMLVNRGYKTLKDQISRGSYLLQLLGHNVDQEEQPHEDQEMLMAVMEANERLANIEHPAQLTALSDESEKRMNKYFEQLSRAFEKQDYISAKTIMYQLRYFNNIRQKIIEKEMEFMH